MAGRILLALGANGVEALSVEVDEMFSVILSTRDGITLEAGAGGSSAAEARGGGDKFHHLKCDLLIAAQRGSRGDGSDRGIAQGDSPGLDSTNTAPPEGQAPRCR